MPDKLPDPPESWRHFLSLVKEILILILAAVAAISGVLNREQGKENKNEIVVTQQKLDAAVDGLRVAGAVPTLK